MGKIEEVFGDPRFTSKALLPTRDNARTLTSLSAAALWSSLAINPVLIEFSLSGATAPQILVQVLVGGLVLALFGTALLSTPMRYGIGFAATARAAFGVRGAQPILFARWLASTIWGGAWIGHLSYWAALFALASFERFANIQWGFSDEAMVQPVAMGFSAILVVLTWRTAGQSVERFGARAPRRFLITVCVALALGGLVAWQVGGVPLSVWRDGERPGRFGQSMAIVVATLPALVAFAEWARRRIRAGVDPVSGRRLQRWRRMSIPFVLIPSALVFAGVSAWIHAAGTHASGAMTPGLVASATASAGALGGGLAMVLGLMWFFSIAPLASFSCSTGGLPGKATSIDRLTALGVLVSATTVHFVPAFSLMLISGFVLLPVVVILIVDGVVVRRGHLALEELYVVPSSYGRFFGFGIAGTAVTFAAWIVLGDAVVVAGLAEATATTHGGLGDVATHIDPARFLGFVGCVAVSYILFRFAELRLPLLPRPRSSSHQQAAGRDSTSFAIGEFLTIEAEPGHSTSSQLLTVEKEAAKEDDEDEWPDDESRSEARWFDTMDDVSNPSVTELGEPHFVKKSDD